MVTKVDRWRKTRIWSILEQADTKGRATVRTGKSARPFLSSCRLSPYGRSDGTAKRTESDKAADMIGVSSNSSP